MTKTENSTADLAQLNWAQLKGDIPHLESVSGDGWILKWDEIELVCKKANAMQVKHLDTLVSDALPKAARVLK